MRFSIVLPSRERVQLLVNLLVSISNTTVNKEQIEVLIAIDDDDKDTLSVTSKFKEYFPFCRFYTVKRSNQHAQDYYNYLAKRAIGKYLLALNDDCLFLTNGWDELIWDKLENYLADKPDGVVYGWISDNLPVRAGGMNYCCFPLVSAAAVNTLGYLFPQQCWAWASDWCIWRVYNTIGRVLDLSEMTIDHISYHNGKRERDEISFRVERLSTENKLYDWNAEAERLLTLMKQRVPQSLEGITKPPVLLKPPENPTKVSFILATCRPAKDFANHAIEAVRQTESYGMAKEIVVVSPEEIPGVKWIRDPAPGTGSVHAYNLAYKHSTGDYIVLFVDDMLIHPEVLKLVSFLKSHIFAAKRFKIVCMQWPDTGICVVRSGRVAYAVACFPVVARETVEKELGGYFFNPQFSHGYADNWLGYWLGINGEPAVWVSNYQLRRLAETTYPTDLPENLDTLWRLIAEHQVGQRKVYAP